MECLLRKNMLSKYDLKQCKKKLEEQRRELRRKQFEERARAMGLDLNQIANLDNLFMQQEIIEQQALEETEKLEEHRGMMM